MAAFTNAILAALVASPAFAGFIPSYNATSVASHQWSHDGHAQSTFIPSDHPQETGAPGESEQDWAPSQQSGSHTGAAPQGEHSWAPHSWASESWAPQATGSPEGLTSGAAPSGSAFPAEPFPASEAPFEVASAAAPSGPAPSDSFPTGSAAGPFSASDAFPSVPAPSGAAPSGAAPSEAFPSSEALSPPEHTFSHEAPVNVSDPDATFSLAYTPRDATFNPIPTTLSQVVVSSA